MKERNDEYLIYNINKAIGELVIPQYRLQKYYNYYNGKRDPEQYRYLEENFGIGQPTSVEFTPLVRKHIDALIGEYIDVPLLPKVSCKDKDTVSKITREKELQITSEVQRYLKSILNNKLVAFLNGKDNVDQSIELALNKLIEDINENFISQYEVAAQDVIEYLIQSRATDFRNKLRLLLLDLLVTGYTFYRAHPSPSKTNVEIETLNPLNVFPDRNPNSIYVKDCYRIVVRYWMTKAEILVKYGDKLDNEAKAELENKESMALEGQYMYVRSFENMPTGVPVTDGLEAGKEVIPGFPYEYYNTYNYQLMPVYEVEWIETDKENGKYIQNRYKGIRICDSIYILLGKDKEVMRSKDNPEYCTLSVNGVFFTNRAGLPYSLMGACMALQDRYDVINFYKDNVIANSGTAGDWLDLAVLPTALGSDLAERIQKYLAYKKSGIAIIDSSQEGAGLSNNTIYSGYDDTLKMATMQAFDLALQRIEDTTSSITGVFRERLNGIQERDAVSNVKVGIQNSYTVTKQYHTQMDTLAVDMLLDCLNIAKIVYKKGLTGTLILGDKYQKVFTALPEYFTLTDWDIHIVASTDIMKEIQTVQQVVMEYIKSGQLDADIIVEAMTAKSLTDLKAKVTKAFNRRKQENNQLQQYAQQLEQAEQTIKELETTNKELNSKLEQLNDRELKLREKELEIKQRQGDYKNRTDRQAQENKAKNDDKRTEIEYAQQFDNNPHNDKIRQI